MELEDSLLLTRHRQPFLSQTNPIYTLEPVSPRIHLSIIQLSSREIFFKGELGYDRRLTLFVNPQGRFVVKVWTGRGQSDNRDKSFFESCDA